MWGLLTLSLQPIFITRSSSSRRPQAYPMLTAVSGLSPVSTHTFIPASRSAWMVSGTFSCRRSSMPVAPARGHISNKGTIRTQILSQRYTATNARLVDVSPSRVRFFSSCTAVSMTSLSLFSIAVIAFFLSTDQRLYTASLTTWNTCRKKMKHSFT